MTKVEVRSHGYHIVMARSKNSRGKITGEKKEFDQSDTKHFMRQVKVPMVDAGVVSIGNVRNRIQK
jgi:hypothetical protein